MGCTRVLSVRYSLADRKEITFELFRGQAPLVSSLGTMAMREEFVSIETVTPVTLGFGQSFTAP